MNKKNVIEYDGNMLIVCRGTNTVLIKEHDLTVIPGMYHQIGVAVDGYCLTTRLNDRYSHSVINPNTFHLVRTVKTDTEGWPSMLTFCNGK